MAKDLCLILDVNYLCHRAFYAMPDLTANGIPTAVAFGFFRDLLDMLERFKPVTACFCFDSSEGKSKRKKLFSAYKQKRKNRTEEQEKLRNRLYQEIDLLRTDYLPSLGYRNIFQEEGFESDDLMASICQNSLEHRKGVVVTSDEDLFQVIRKGKVVIWKPREGELWTENLFRQKYGISPEEWAEVKAIGGCSTDGVPGVKGVGQDTAVKYVRGCLPTGRFLDKIRRGKSVIAQMRPLVTLPFPGTPVYELSDKLATKRERWFSLFERLNIKALQRTLIQAGVVE